MIQKIDHINIVVRDLEKARQFFEDLGFVCTNDRAELLEGEWVEKLTGLKNVTAFYYALTLPNSQVSLELLKYESPEDKDDQLIGKPNHLGFRHMAFAVENIEKFVNDLQEKGVKFFSEIQEYKPTKKKLCYFYGPEGIVLEVAEYGK